MNPREIINKAHQNIPVPNILLPYFQGILSKDVRALASEIHNYIQLKPHGFLEQPIDCNSMSEIAYNFHVKAGTLTENVKANIERIRLNAPRIRMAHQTNLFLSMAVTGQLVLLNETARYLHEHHQIQSAQLYIALDYDIAEDSRFRVSHYPDAIRIDGSIKLSGAVTQDYRNKPMWAVPKPTQSVVSEWLNQIETSINENLIVLKKYNIPERERGGIKSNFKKVSYAVQESLDRADSLIEFNAFFLSKIVNSFWNLPTAFITGSKIQPLMKNGYEFVLQLNDKINEATLDAQQFFTNQGVILKGNTKDPRNSFPIWYVCSKCQERLELIKDENSLHKVRASRKDCGCNLEFDFGTVESPNLVQIASNMTPRIILDNLLDVVSLGIVGGSGYIGQAEHLVLTNFVASKLGFVIPPQCLHSPKSIYNSISEYRAAIIAKNNPPKLAIDKAISSIKWIHSGRASLVYFLVNFGLENLHTVWLNKLTENNMNGFTPIASTPDIEDEIKKLIALVTENKDPH
jgi:hypothetical protein